MKRLLTFIVMIMVVAGCAQLTAKDVSVSGIYDASTIGDTVFDAYLVSTGIGQRLRAALLIKPENNIQVSMPPVGIRASGTVAEAMRFMVGTSSMKGVTVEGVTVSGEVVGYLLRQREHPFKANTLEISIYKKNGVLYFSAEPRDLEDM